MTKATTYRVEVVNGGESFDCAADSDVLRAMECLGRKGIPVGCRGGGCGVCKVRVIEGPYRTGVMSRACVSHEEQADGYALACKLFAEGDVRLQVVGRRGSNHGAIHMKLLSPSLSPDMQPPSPRPNPRAPRAPPCRAGSAGAARPGTWP